MHDNKLLRAKTLKQCTYELILENGTAITEGRKKMISAFIDVK